MKRALRRSSTARVPTLELQARATSSGNLLIRAKLPKQTLFFAPTNTISCFNRFFPPSNPSPIQTLLFNSSFTIPSFVLLLNLCCIRSNNGIFFLIYYYFLNVFLSKKISAQTPTAHILTSLKGFPYNNTC